MNSDQQTEKKEKENLEDGEIREEKIKMKKTRAGEKEREREGGQNRES